MPSPDRVAPGNGIGGKEFWKFSWENGREYTEKQELSWFFVDCFCRVAAQSVLIEGDRAFHPGFIRFP